MMMMAFAARNTGWRVHPRGPEVQGHVVHIVLALGPSFQLFEKTSKNKVPSRFERLQAHFLAQRIESCRLRLLIFHFWLDATV